MQTEIWKFETARFRVVYSVSDCYSLDLSFDDNGEIAERLDDGDLVAFDATVAVYLDGNEIASDHLGDCIYESADHFRDHIGISKIARIKKARKDAARAVEYFNQRRVFLMSKRSAGYGRAYYIRGMEGARNALRDARHKLQREIARGDCVYGSHFSDMVRQACAEARAHIRATNPVTIRDAA